MKLQHIFTALLASHAFFSSLTFSLLNAQSLPPVLLQEVQFLNPGQSGLTNPLQVVNAGDGSNRLFIVQKGGTIKVLERSNDNTFTDEGIFFSISGIQTLGEQGLLSAAFDPEFSENKRFYVFYTNSGGDLELARYETGDDPNVADPATATILLTIPHPVHTNHNGGEMHFGPDGMLYLSTGDGGSGGAPAQNMSSYLGKILRIDVNTPGLIPANNPIPGSLVYASGLRNPFRWSFDRSTQDIWLGDVGQGRREEINHLSFAQLRNANFGWPCYEGELPYNSSECGDPEDYLFPIHTYEIGDTHGRSVVGGVVYRGAAFTSLQGYYIGADYFSTKLHVISQSGSTFSFSDESTGVMGISDFGESENGEVYVVSNSTNTLYRVVPDPSLPVRFVDFSVTETEEKQAQLTWKTMQSEDLNTYEVLRGFDGENFSLISAVSGNTILGETVLYSLTDPDIQRHQVYYYRIKALANDGSFLYSPIVSFSSGGADPTRFIYPNIITQNRIDVTLGEPFEYLELISVSGQRVQKFELGSKTGKFRINPGYVTPGVYLARFIRDHEVRTERVIFP